MFLLLIVALATAFHVRRQTLPRSAVIVFAVCSVLLVAYTFTRPAGMYSGDESIKLAQSIAILDGQIELTYPGAELDPGRHHFPHGPPWVVIEDGHFYGVYSVVFAAPSALAWSVCGYWGLYIWPLLGGLATLWYVMRLAHRTLPGAPVVIALLVMTTPIVLDAALFNEHAPACGLVLFALVHGCSPKRGLQLASGAAASIAIAIRPELVTGIPALIVFFIAASTDGLGAAARRIGWMALGGIAPLTIHVVANLVTIGVPSPVLHETYVPLPRAAWGLDIIPSELEQTGVVLFIPIVVAVVLALVPPRPRLERARTVAIALAAVAWLVVEGGYLYRTTNDAFAHPAALLAATPLFVLGLALGPYRARDGDDVRLARALWLFAIVGIAAMMMINTSMGHGGRIGARFILVYMPALAIASVVVAKRSRLLSLVAIAAVGFGVWAQVLESRQLGRARGRSAAVVAALQSRPEPYVFSGLFWGPQVAGPVWGEKQIFNSGSAIGPLLSEIKRRGNTTVIDLVGGLEQWAKLQRAPRIELVPIDLGTPRVRVYRFTPSP